MHKVKSHKTVEQIAKKHRLEVSFIKNQLKMGIPIEHEHTKDRDLATDIALQHLDEIPDYYTRLKKMESSAKKEHKRKFKDVSEGAKMKGPDPCWKGYEMIGKKKKNGKEVPNCVPVKENHLMIRYCPKCKKDETRSECKYGEKYWDMFSIPSLLGKKHTPNTPHPGNFPESYNQIEEETTTPTREEKAKIRKIQTLHRLMKAAKENREKSDVAKESVTIEDLNGNSFAEVVDIIGPNQMEPVVDEGCWKGYKQVGMKKKGARLVPNCVKESYSNWREELFEDWQKINRQDKTDGLSQKAVDAYRRENPGSKLQTAVTEKKPTGKRAKRRKSFCSRMKGHKAKNTSAKTARDPDSRINKALRRWNCH